MAETASLATLPSTRRQILVGLKKRGEARAEELARDLGVTASAVRQHLTGLVAHGFVVHREVKGSPGRPKHVYHLTDVAEALFPKTYSELTNEVLAIVETESPELLQTVFDRRRDRRIEQARERIAAAGDDFSTKVAEVATILDEDGYLADWEALPDGTYRVTEHNCAVLGVAAKYGQACSSEIEFLRAVLPGATIERVAHMMAGEHHCAYVITPANPATKARPPAMNRQRRRRGTQP